MLRSGSRRHFLRLTDQQFLPARPPTHSNIRPLLCLFPPCGAHASLIIPVILVIWFQNLNWFLEKEFARIPLRFTLCFLCVALALFQAVYLAFQIWRLSTNPFYYKKHQTLMGFVPPTFSLSFLSGTLTAEVCLHVYQCSVGL